MHFFTCSKHKFIWFTDQNVCSWFHQLWHFYHFFFQLEIRVLDLLPLYLLPTSHLSWKIPLPLYPRVQKMGGIFTALDCWAVAQGGAGEKSLKHVACMYTWTSPAQLGSPPTALHVFWQGVSDPVHLCSDMHALLQPFTVFFRLFSMWFHSVTWQRVRGRHGKDQCKLFSSHPSLIGTHRDGQDLPTCRLLSPSRDVHTKRGCLSLQFSSVTQSCLTLCSPMDCSMPGLPVHHWFLELTQTHVHWVGDAIQLSHPLSSPSPPDFNLSEHKRFFQ